MQAGGANHRLADDLAIRPSSHDRAEVVMPRENSSVPSIGSMSHARCARSARRLRHGAPIASPSKNVHGNPLAALRRAFLPLRGPPALTAVPSPFLSTRIHPPEIPQRNRVRLLRDLRHVSVLCLESQLFSCELISSRFFPVYQVGSAPFSPNHPQSVSVRLEDLTIVVDDIQKKGFR